MSPFSSYSMGKLRRNNPNIEYTFVISRIGMLREFVLHIKSKGYLSVGFVYIWRELSQARCPKHQLWIELRMSSDRELFTALEGNSLIPAVKARSPTTNTWSISRESAKTVFNVTVILVSFRSWILLSLRLAFVTKRGRVNSDIVKCTKKWLC